MSATAATFDTPKLFAAVGVRAHSRALVVSLLSLILLVGAGLRAYHLSAEGLSEDEFNKLSAVADYRAHGLTSANGEHPFLMKALLTLSVIASEQWNESRLVAAHPQLRVAEETALRLPSVVFGTFTALLLFLLVTELFGPTTALIAAALWALDPAAVSVISVSLGRRARGWASYLPLGSAVDGRPCIDWIDRRDSQVMPSPVMILAVSDATRI